MKSKSQIKRLKIQAEAKVAFLPYNLTKLDKPKTAILCLSCGIVLSSYFRHDYKTCDCPNAAMVDGGYDYIRYGAVDMDKIQWVILAPEGFNVVAEKQPKVVKKGVK